MMTGTPTPRLDLACIHTHRYISGCVSFQHFQEGFYYIHIHKWPSTGYLVEDDMQTHTRTHTHAWFLAATHVPPLCLQDHFPSTHAALHATCELISPVWTRVLIRDCRLADCTVRYLGVERPFYSLEESINNDSYVIWYPQWLFRYNHEPR